MRKLLSFITVMLMIVVFPSCNSLDKQLDGLWVAENEIEYAADNNLRLTTALLLDNSNKECKYQVFVVSQTTGLLCKVTFPGTWKVEDENLVLDIKKPEVDSESVVATRGTQAGADGAEFEPELISNLTKQLQLDAPMKVVKIEDDDLTLEINGKSVEFDKKEKDYNIKSNIRITEKMKQGVAHMNGAIGKYAIEMELVAMPDGKVAGRYRYNRIGEWLYLYGQHKSDGKVDLIEKTSDGMVTGHYIGKITNGPGKDVKFSGQFDSYQGKTYTFEVKGEYEDVNPQLQYKGEEIDSSDDYSVSAGGSSDWDEILDDYEEYVDQLIAMLPKIKNGDPTALLDYTDLASSCASLSEKLGNADGELSAQQMNRLNRITAKYQKAASQLPNM